MTLTSADDVQPSSAPAAAVPVYQQEVAAVMASLRADEAFGLSAAEAASRLAEHGPNQITSEKPPSMWAVALGQLRDPMNLMLVAVAVVSLVIGEVPTAIVVALLVVLNVVLGARQELKARASVDALSKMQVPQTRCGAAASSSRFRPSRSSLVTSCRSRPVTSCPPTGG